MDGHILMNMDEVISQGFSSSHKAIDIVGSGARADDVIAFSDGTVEIAVNTVTGNRKGSRGTASYGNFVKIRHDNGMKTLYAHMEYGSVSVKTGDRISKGQVIGRMGDSGNAYGVHLHFEIRGPDDLRINPYSYLFEKDHVNEFTVNSDNLSNDSILTDSDLNDSSLGDTEDNINLKDSDKTVEKRDDFSLNKVLEKNAVDNSKALNDSYFSNSGYEYGSIVDGLKYIGADSSFDYRTLIAYENGIHNYRGSYEQNIKLLVLLKQGKLKKV